MRSQYSNSQRLFAMSGNFAKQLSQKFHACYHAAFYGCFLSNKTTSINEDQTDI